MLGIFRKSYSNSISRSTITEVNQKLTLFLTPCPYFCKNNKVPFENLYGGGGVLQTNIYLSILFSPPPSTLIPHFKGTFAIFGQR